MNRPLSNPEAESLAVSLSLAKSKEERRKLGNDFLENNPGIKRWEILVIQDRARFLTEKNNLTIAEDSVI